MATEYGTITGGNVVKFKDTIGDDTVYGADFDVSFLVL